MQSLLIWIFEFMHVLRMQILLVRVLITTFGNWQISLMQI